MKILSTIAACLYLFAVPANANIMVASWYDCATAGQCGAKKITASGEKFNMWGHTAAHRTLPFGTKLRVTYKGRTVIV